VVETKDGNALQCGGLYGKQETAEWEIRKRRLQKLDVRIHGRYRAGTAKDPLDGRGTVRLTAGGDDYILVVYGHIMGRIVTAPSAAREVNLRPRVHVALLRAGAAGPVSTDETRGDAHGAACIDKEHRNVAAGAAAILQSVRGQVGGAGLPDGNRTGAVDFASEGVKESQGVSAGCLRYRVSEVRDSRLVMCAGQIWGKGRAQIVAVGDRQPLAGRGQEVIEGIAAKRLHLERYLDGELCRRLVEPRVEHRITFDIEAVREGARFRVDPRLEAHKPHRAVAARPQPDDVRLERHRFAVSILRRVIDGKVHRGRKISASL
jgi:hypothetical protein